MLSPLRLGCVLALCFSAALGQTVAVDVTVRARVERADGTTADLEVKNGGVLRTGDRVQVQVTPEVDSYIYVLVYGSSQKAAMLHPYSAKASDAFSSGGALRKLPRPDIFLPLDDREGRELVFVLATREPARDMGSLLASMEKQGEDILAVTEAVRHRFPDAKRVVFRHVGSRPLTGGQALTNSRQFSGLRGTGRRSEPNSELPLGPSAPVAASSAEPSAELLAAESSRSPTPVETAKPEATPGLKLGIEPSEFESILGNLPATGGRPDIPNAGEEVDETVLSGAGKRIGSLLGHRNPTAESLAESLAESPGSPKDAPVGNDGLLALLGVKEAQPKGSQSEDLGSVLKGYPAPERQWPEGLASVRWGGGSFAGVIVNELGWTVVAAELVAQGEGVEIVYGREQGPPLPAQVVSVSLAEGLALIQPIGPVPPGLEPAALTERVAAGDLARIVAKNRSDWRQAMIAGTTRGAEPEGLLRARVDAVAREALGDPSSFLIFSERFELMGIGSGTIGSDGRFSAISTDTLRQFLIAVGVREVVTAEQR